MYGVYGPWHYFAEVHAYASDSDLAGFAQDQLRMVEYPAYILLSSARSPIVSAALLFPITIARPPDLGKRKLQRYYGVSGCLYGPKIATNQVQVLRLQ